MMFEPLPTALYTAVQVRALDNCAIRQFKVPGKTLMARAGEALFRLMEQRWPAARTLLVFAGVGNNAGDGYVLARLAYQAGYDVTLYPIGDVKKLTGDALDAYKAALSAGLRTTAYSADANLSNGLIIDALIGTGLVGPVKEEWQGVIEHINTSNSEVLSVDIPSGLCADTGAVLGSCVQATATLSFIGLKRGLLTARGPDVVGTLYFADLDVPPEVYQSLEPETRRLSDVNVPRLKPRRPSSNKGDFGHVLIVGGNRGMAGAAKMAGEAAYRSGAGLVSIATHPEHAATLNVDRPELMCHGIQSVTDLASLESRATVVALGPGLGMDEWARSLFMHLINWDQPLILDADALKLLVTHRPQRRPHEWVLTPHPGEAHHLLGVSTEAVQMNRFKAIEDIYHQYQACCVLKGAGTMVINEWGDISICDKGNPGMATGGMGDVLTGLIAGLIGQGLCVGDASQLGVYVHALAGDKAANQGERGLIATDLMPYIRDSISDF